jgi:hypothetical protein
MISDNIKIMLSDRFILPTDMFSDKIILTYGIFMLHDNMLSGGCTLYRRCCQVANISFVIFMFSDKKWAHKPCCPIKLCCLITFCWTTLCCLITFYAVFFSWIVHTLVTHINNLCKLNGIVDTDFCSNNFRLLQTYSRPPLHVLNNGIVP